MRAVEELDGFENWGDYESLTYCEGFVYEEDFRMHEGLGNFDYGEWDSFESLSWILEM